ncbi:WD40-repeat-containing domain protein [Xylaria curta]|nr:WD40-repeat-containing domain protein [Xylaria curta]
MIGKLPQRAKMVSQKSRTEAGAERPSDPSLNVVTSHTDTINDISKSQPSEPITKSVSTEEIQDTYESELVDIHNASQEEDKEKACLWDTAYDYLRKQHPNLIDRYEAIITDHLTQGVEESDIQTDKLFDIDLSVTRSQMTKVLEVWLNKVIEEDANNNANSKRTNLRTRSIKNIIRDLIQRSPRAPMIWLATCLYIITLHDDIRRTMPHPSFIYVIQKIEWYLSLSKLFLNDRNCTRDLSGVVDLYKAILHTTISAACVANGKFDVSHSDQKCPTKEDIMRLEEALTYSFSGNKTIQLSKLLVTAESENNGDSSEEAPKTASDDDRSKNQLLNKLQVSHQPISSMRTEERDFLESFSRWAIQTPEYRDWVSQRSCQVLWVTGDPGSGKTALLQSLTQRLLGPQSKLVSEPIATVAYFISQPKADRKNLTSALKSLIWQVLKSQPQLSNHLEQKLHDTGRECFDGPNDFYAMSSLLCTLVRDENFSTTCFVLGEIEELYDEPRGDEYSNSMSRFGDKWGQRDILELISTTSRLSTRVKWIVSTRDANIDISRLDTEHFNSKELLLNPENFRSNLANDYSGTPSMVENTDQASQILDGQIQQTGITMTDVHYKPQDTQPRTAHIHLSSTMQDMQHVMKVYVAMKIFRLAGKVRLTSNLQFKISELLLSRSPRNNFLWLDMVCDIVEAQEIPWSAPRVIQGLATDVSSLYRQRKESLSEFGEENEGYCNIILSTAMIAFRPLSLDEFRTLVNLPAYVDIVIIIERMCFSFLETVDNKVYFKHSSAQEYLRKEMKENGGLLQMHLKMVKQCLRVTLDNLRLPSDTVKSRMVNYASIHWIRHLAAVDIDRALEMMEHVNEFLKGHLMQWLEVLASQGLLTQAREYLQIMESLWAEKTLKETRPHSNRTASTEKNVLDFTVCFRIVRMSIDFLNFHQSLHSPQGLSPRNSLLFYPRLDELKEMILLEGWPEGLTIAPNIRTSSQEIGSCEHILTGHTDWIRDCAYSPDGRLIATVSDDKSVRLWDSNTGKAQHVLKFNYGYPEQIVFCEQLGILAVRDSSTTQFWDVFTGEQVNLLPPKDLDRGIHSIAFSPDGQIRVHDTTPCENLDIHSAFSSDGRLLAWAAQDSDYQIMIWDIENSQVLHQLRGHKDKINDLVFSPDSLYLASGSGDCTFRIWHVETGEELNSYNTSPDRVRSVAFSTDDRRLACGSGNKVRIWKAVASAQVKASYMKQYEEEDVFRGHLKPVSTVRFSPDGRHLLSSSFDTTARIWRLNNIDVDMAMTKDLSLTLPGTDGQQVSPRGPLLCHKTSVCFVKFSVDGKMAASGSFDGEILLWDAGKGTPIRALTGGHSRPIKSLAFSRNGKFLISAGNDGTVGIWDTGSGKMIRKLEGHTDWIRSAVLSPDEQFVASASDDKTVRVWNIKNNLAGDENRESVEEDQNLSGKPIVQKESRILLGHWDYVVSVAFSSDGRYLASGADDGRILIWDLCGDADNNQQNTTLRKKDDEDYDEEADRENPCAELRRIDDAVRGLVFAPNDSETLISVTGTGTICVWKRGEQRGQWEWQCTKSFTKNDIGWNRIDKNPQFLHFDLDHPEILLSEYGALPVKTTSSSRPYALASSKTPPYWSRYGVRECGGQAWITRDNENLIFLPEQYRPSDNEPCSVQVRRQRVIIGCESGQVLIFGFTEDKGPEIPLSKTSTSK